MSTVAKGSLPRMPVAPPLPKALSTAQAPPSQSLPGEPQKAAEIDKNTFLSMMAATAVILLALIFGVLLKSYSEKDYQEVDLGAMHRSDAWEFSESDVPTPDVPMDEPGQ